MALIWHANNLHSVHLTAFEVMGMFQCILYIYQVVFPMYGFHYLIIHVELIKDTIVGLYLQTWADVYNGLKCIDQFS